MGRYSFSEEGWWSRHIDDGNRLVYRMIGDELDIATCKDHYSDY